MFFEHWTVWSNCDNLSAVLLRKDFFFPWSSTDTSCFFNLRKILQSKLIKHTFQRFCHNTPVFFPLIVIAGKLSYIIDLCGRRQVTPEESRVAVWSCRDRVRKTKADLALNLARGVKHNNKGFGHINGRKKTGETVGLLLNGAGWLQQKPWKVWGTPCFLCLSLC